MTKIVLIRPRDNIENPWFTNELTNTPPLSLGIIAALTPQGYELEIVDECIGDKIRYDDADLVAISAVSSSVLRAYEIAEKFRDIGTKVVIGGTHTHFMYDEALRYVDCVILGEAECTWHRVLDDFTDGNLKKIYANCLLDPALIPFPRRDLFKIRKYSHLDALEASRGCPYYCEFCVSPSFFGKLRTRPIHGIIKELESLRRDIFFVDDNIIGSAEYSKNLFKAMIPLGKKWIGQSPILIAKNDELLNLAVESGCVGVLVGFESLSSEGLKQIDKRFQPKDVKKEYKFLIKRLHDYGIIALGSFVFGIDGQKKDCFKGVMDFCMDVDLGLGNFPVLTPYPGTRLFDRLQREDRIITYDWAKYNGWDIVFTPTNMSVEELEEGGKCIWRDFYSISSIAKRGFKQKHLFNAFYGNYQFRKMALCNTAIRGK